MDVTFLVVILPLVALPFLRKHWSLVATYWVYGSLFAFLMFSVWFNLNHHTHMSQDLAIISGIFALGCILICLLARFLRIKFPR